MQIQILLTVFAFAFAYASENECDPHCADYHRHCDDLALGQAPTSLNPLEEERYSTQEFNCSETYWSERCPLTCNACTACDLMAEIESLREQFENRGALFAYSGSSSLAAIVTATSGSGYFSSAYYYDKVYDGSFDMQSGRYSSPASGSAWMQLTLNQKYKVSTVSVNIISDWSGMRPHGIKVCTSSDGVDCISCGGDWIGDIPSGSNTPFWSYVQCPKGTSGNYIYFWSTGGITFTEAKFSSS
jgi:hypothetical protein